MSIPTTAPAGAKPFVARMAEVFKMPGQAIGSFSAELKELNDADRQWYCDQLNKCGFPTMAPAKTAN